MDIELFCKTYQHTIQAAGVAVAVLGFLGGVMVAVAKVIGKTTVTMKKMSEDMQAEAKTTLNKTVDIAEKSWARLERAKALDLNLIYSEVGRKMDKLQEQLGAKPFNLEKIRKDREDGGYNE